MGHATARIAFGALFALGFLLPTPARAKEEEKTLGETELAQARAAAKKGDLAQAGQTLGELVTTAVRLKEPHLEQRAAEALEEILDGVEADASPDARPDATAETWPGRAKAREVLAAAMKPLDAKRHGLFVSAHSLAAWIVLDAAALGDAEHLSEAGIVLATYAGTAKAGAAALAFARLAEGIRLARMDDAAKASAALEDAARRGQPFLAPALYADLELAVLRQKGGDAAKSAQAIAAACALAPRDADSALLKDWMHAVETRWKDAPKEGLEAFRQATKPFLEASAGTAGGRGGAGGAAGGGLSPIGRAFAKWPAGKAFAVVRRAKSAFEIRLPFDDKPGATQPLGRGARAWDSSGVTILLAGPAVALRMIDGQGTAGQPGERLRPGRAWAYYWLAEGETWGATKDGVVVSGP